MKRRRYTYKRWRILVRTDLGWRWWDHTFHLRKDALEFWENYGPSFKEGMLYRTEITETVYKLR